MSKIKIEKGRFELTGNRLNIYQQLPQYDLTSPEGLPWVQGQNKTIKFATSYQVVDGQIVWNYEYLHEALGKKFVDYWGNEVTASASQHVEAQLHINGKQSSFYVPYVTNLTGYKIDSYLNAPVPVSFSVGVMRGGTFLTVPKQTFNPTQPNTLIDFAFCESTRDATSEYTFYTFPRYDSHSSYYIAANLTSQTGYIICDYGLGDGRGNTVYRPQTLLIL